MTSSAAKPTIWGMFKRLCYLIAEGFEICSVQASDGEGYGNGRILYRITNTREAWRLRSEEFHVEAPESKACAELFIDYLHSEGAS